MPGRCSIGDMTTSKQGQSRVHVVRWVALQDFTVGATVSRPRIHGYAPASYVFHFPTVGTFGPNLAGWSARIRRPTYVENDENHHRTGEHTTHQHEEI